MVFTTLAHAGALEDVVAAVREILHPAVLMGAAGEAIVGTGREVEGGPGVSLWAGTWGPVMPVRIDGRHGIPSAPPFPPAALVLAGDPYSVPIDEVLAEAEARLPGVPVLGGMVSGARGPGGSRLALDGAVYTTGAVGVLIGPGADVVPLVSQGCRPVGQPFVVTDGGGQIIRELGGRPALTRLEELAGHLTPAEVHAVNRGGLHIGIVIDERRTDWATGDFLVRDVIGGDKQTGAIAIGGEVNLGVTVQFHIRDADAAHDDLLALLSEPGARAEAACLFTCNGRGIHLFGTPDHDAGLIADRFGAIPTAGFFAAGELGPVGGRNELHTFTAAMLLLRERGVPRVTDDG
jgi:small ligand-binding sensory domain FIST